MPQVTNPELIDPVPQGGSLPDADGAANRGRHVNNEILTMLSIGIALAGLLILLWGNTNTHISRLDDRINRVEDRIDRLEAKLDAGIDKLDARIDKLDARIDKLDDKIDKLDDKIDKLDVKFDSLLLALARSNVISPAEADRAAKSR